MIPDNPSSKDLLPSLPRDLPSVTNKNTKDKEKKISKVAIEKREVDKAQPKKLASELRAKPAVLPPKKAPVPTVDRTISTAVDTIGSAFPSFFSEIETELLTLQPNPKHLPDTGVAAIATPQGVVGASLSVGASIGTYTKELHVSKRSILSAGLEALKGVTQALFEKVKTVYNQGYEALCSYFSSSKEIFSEIVVKSSSILSQGSFAEDKITSALLFAANKLLLVEKTSYDAELASLKAKLAKSKNTSTIVPCVQQLSEIAVQFVDYHIVNAKDIPLEQQPLFMRKFVRNRPEGKTEVSFLGKIAGTLLKDNKELLQKCLEANITPILQTVMETLEKLQAENPHIITDIISKLCDTMDFDRASPFTAQEEKKLLSAVTKELLSIALPNGIGSLKIPFIPPLDKVAGAAMEYCMPLAIENAFSHVLHATTRERVLLAATKSIKQSFELISTTNPKLRRPAETKKPSEKPYPNQASFNANVAKGIRHMMNWIDKRMYNRVFKHFPFEKVLEKSGPEIASELSKIDLSTSFSQGLEDITKRLATQKIDWKELKGQFDIMTNPKAREALGYKLQIKVQDTISSIQVDIKAIAKQIIESHVSKSEEKALDDLLSDSATTKRNAKIRLAFINFGKKIRQFFLVALFRILRLQTRIPSICNVAITKVRELHLPYVVGSTLQGALAVAKTSKKRKPGSHH